MLLEHAQKLEEEEDDEASPQQMDSRSPASENPRASVTFGETSLKAKTSESAEGFLVRASPPKVGVRERRRPALLDALTAQGFLRVRAKTPRTPWRRRDAKDADSPEELRGRASPGKSACVSRARPEPLEAHIARAFARVPAKTLGTAARARKPQGGKTCSEKRRETKPHGPFTTSPPVAPTDFLELRPQSFGPCF